MRVDPTTEPVAFVGLVVEADAGVTVLLNKLFQHPEPFLEGSRGHLHELHLEGTGEVGINLVGQVGVQSRGERQLLALAQLPELSSQFVEFLAKLIVV